MGGLRAEQRWELRSVRAVCHRLVPAEGTSQLLLAVDAHGFAWDCTGASRAALPSAGLSVTAQRSCGRVCATQGGGMVHGGEELQTKHCGKA